MINMSTVASRLANSRFASLEYLNITEYNPEPSDAIWLGYNLPAFPTKILDFSSYT